MRRIAALHPYWFCCAAICSFVACGDDESASDDAGSAGAAISGSGGAGAGTGTAGQAVAGSSGTTGASGRAGGAAGAAGSGGAGQSGSSGAAAGASAAAGSGGEGAPAVRWVGRVDASDPAAVKFSWQGAGFVARVHGTSIAVKLRTEGTDSVFFQAVIDGKAAPRAEVKSGADRTLMLGDGLSDTTHDVELYRDTEGMYGVSTFTGFASGTLKAPAASSGRSIEVVGDSISAGYGNLGSESHPAPNWTADPACHWTAANSSWYQTYASVAGHALDADVSTVARSGWGMYRDNGGSTAGVLPSVYDQTLGSAADPKFGFEPKASAVIVNLGTNDWAQGDPGKPYEDAYASFLANVRTRYPNAFIFITIGSMLSNPALGQVDMRLQAVVAARAAAGDDKVTTFDIGTQPLGDDGKTPTGCDWHPNVADHARMAAILQAKLKEKLGW